MEFSWIAWQVPQSFRASRDENRSTYSTAMRELRESQETMHARTWQYSAPTCRSARSRTSPSSTAIACASAGFGSARRTTRPLLFFYSLTSRHSLLPFTAPRVRALRDPRPRRQPPDDQAQFIQRHALLRPGTKARRLSPLAGVRALQSPCRPRAHAYNGWVRAKPARFTDGEPVYSAESVPW